MLNYFSINVLSNKISESFRVGETNKLDRKKLIEVMSQFEAGDELNKLKCKILFFTDF